MQNCLFFICPADYLESIIYKEFRSRNYYYTSLGNSVVFDKNTTEQIIQLIKENNITEVSFVLSEDNEIILDALEQQGFSNIKGLNNFYTEIVEQKKLTEILWQKSNHRFSILSFYLNEKIKELQLVLEGLSIDSIKMSGKIYDRESGRFKSIYSDLICREVFSLN